MSENFAHRIGRQEQGYPITVLVDVVELRVIEYSLRVPVGDFYGRWVVDNIKRNVQTYLWSQLIFRGNSLLQLLESGSIFHTIVPLVKWPICIMFQGAILTGISGLGWTKAEPRSLAVNGSELRSATFTIGCWT